MKHWHYFVLQTNLLLAANIIINLIHYIYVYTHYYCQLSINEICHCKNCYFCLTTTRSATSVSSVLVVISGEIYQLLFWRLPHREHDVGLVVCFFSQPGNLLSVSTTTDRCELLKSV